MAKGVYKWTTIDRVSNSVFTLGANITLARLLTPDDFGLLAMVTIFIAISMNVSSCGMADGLIRKLHPSDDDYSTVFTFNAIAGLVCCCVFFATGPSLARFFNQPPLVDIMRVIGVCFFFNTLCWVQETRLRKELEIKKIAIVRISATIVATALGIVLAATGFSYWGLVSCRIFLLFFLFAFYGLATRWYPRLYISRRSFHELFGYGINLFVAYVSSQISAYINSFVLGRYSADAAGQYSQAQKIEEVPFKTIEASFNWTFFAVLSNIKATRERRNVSREMLGNLGFIGSCISLLLVLLAYPAVVFVFGAKWEPAVPIIRILAIFGFFYTFRTYAQTILKVYNRTDMIRNISFLELVIQVTLLAIFYHHGIQWIAWTQVMGACIGSSMYAYYYCRLLHQTASDFMRAFAGPVIVPAAAFAAAGALYIFVTQHMAPLPCLALTLAAFALVGVALWEVYPHPIYTKFRNKVTGRFRVVFPGGPRPTP